MSWATLWRSSRRRSGLFTLDQAREHGISDDQLHRRVKAGELRIVRRKVYMAASTPPRWETELLAVCLAAGPATWVAGRTAARLWQLPHVAPPDAIDVLTPDGRQVALDGVRHHRSNHVYTADCTLHRDVPVTSAARTIVDCLPYIRRQKLGKVVDSARRERLLTMRSLAECVGRLDHGGGRLVVPMRAILADRVRELGPGDSDRELWVLRVLVDGGLPTPVLQHPVEVEGRTRFIDLAYPEWRIALEFQGYWDHGVNRSRFDDDADRNGGLAADGWVVIPVTSRTRPQALVARVERAIARTA